MLSDVVIFYAYKSYFTHILPIANNTNRNIQISVLELSYATRLTIYIEIPDATRSVSRVPFGRTYSLSTARRSLLLMLEQ